MLSVIPSLALADLAITLSCCGFIDSWRFQSDNVYQQLTSEYSFTKSPHDYLMLSLIRCVLSAYSCKDTEKGSVNENLITLFCIISACFSSLKLLACSVDSSALDYQGSWLIAFWSIVAAIVHILLIRGKPQAAKVVEKDESSTGEVNLTRWDQTRIILSYVLADWPALVISLCLTFASATVSVVLPHYSATVLNGVTNMSENENLSSTIRIFAALTVLNMVLTGVRGGYWKYASSLIASRMRKDLFKSVIQQEIGFFDENKTGQIVSRLTVDVSNVGITLSYNLNHSIRNMLILSGKLIFMATLSWKLTVINIILCPITFYVTKVCGEFTEKTDEELGETSANFNQAAQEIISTIRTVRAFAAEKLSALKFDEIIDKADEINLKQSLARTGLHFTNDLYYNAIYGFTLIAGAHLVSIGHLEAATLVIFMTYQVQIGEHVVELNWSIPQIMGTLGKSRKFCEFLVRKPKMPSAGRIIVPVEGEIKMENVHFSYPSRPDNLVLQNLSLHVRSGETLALVGPSGGGKSTIVSLIKRFYYPDSGVITMDGIPITDFEHEYFHKKVSIVPQEPVLYDCSVHENIGLGCDASKDEIIAAAKIANAHDFVMGLEKGYETNCGERGAQMSGGQKQRIAIARALVRNPSVLILDEATSALDNQSEQIVQEAMERCSQNRTVIVIAHRLTTILKADRIAVIDKGEVVQLGSHGELLKDKDGLYYTLARSNQI